MCPRFLQIPTLLWLVLATAGCGGAPLAPADAGPDSTLSDSRVPDATQRDAADSAPDVDPACQGVPAAGRCDGELLRSCPGGTLIERDCEAESLHCLQAAGEPPRCGAAPGDCQDLPPGGLCVGEALTLCHADWLRDLSCTTLGGVCGVAGGRPGCEPGGGGPRTATGTITGDGRPYDESGLGSLQSRPAEGVTVVLHRGADDAPLGFGITDATGHYSISYDIGGGPDGVYLRVSAFHFTASHRTWVTDDTDATYSFESATVDDSNGQPTLDLHVTEGQDSGALNIFGVLFRNTSTAVTWTQTLMPPLQAYWERGEHLYCGTCHSAGRIFLLGHPDDTDEFDDSVISHEFGHYLAWARSRDDTPGGAHDGTPTDPRLAWSEGLATWMGLQLMGETLYIDTKATGATVRDPEEMGWDADPFGPLDQDLSEFVVLESLWDLTDPVDATDPMARPPQDVLSVLFGYLPSANMADRAHTGVDLVDFLDGWFCSGQGDTPGITSLIVTGQGFPYDFAGPAAPCPKPTEPVTLTLRHRVNPDGSTDVQLTLQDRLGSPEVRARLVLPDGLRHLPASTRLLGPVAAHTPADTTWRLPSTAAPAWVRVAVTVDRGAGGRDHLTQTLWLQPRPTRRAPIRRLHLGDLLTLRLSN